jgi:hypothetical protein
MRHVGNYSEGKSGQGNRQGYCGDRDAQGSWAVLLHALVSIYMLPLHARLFFASRTVQASSFRLANLFFFCTGLPQWNAPSGVFAHAGAARSYRSSDETARVFCLLISTLKTAETREPHVGNRSEGKSRPGDRQGYCGDRDTQGSRVVFSQLFVLLCCRCVRGSFFQVGQCRHPPPGLRICMLGAGLLQWNPTGCLERVPTFR